MVEQKYETAITNMPIYRKEVERLDFNSVLNASETRYVLGVTKLLLDLVDLQLEKIAALKAERDAAIRDIKQIMTDLDVCHEICVYCEYDKDCDGACSPKWRGLEANYEQN